MPKKFETSAGVINLPDDWTPEQVDEHMKNEGVTKYRPFVEPTNKVITKNAASSLAKGIEFARPIVVPAAAVGAGIIGTGIGGPALGAASATGTGVIIDQALQMAQGSDRPTSFLEKGLKLDPNSFSGRAASTAEMLATNEIGGAIIKPLYKYGKAALAAKMGLTPEVFDTAVQDYATKLGATFSQYKGNRKVAQFIEDVFAPGTKEKSLEASSVAGADIGSPKAAGLAGRTKEFIRDPNKPAAALSEALNESFFLSMAKSNERAAIARDIAKQNPQVIIHQLPGGKVAAETIEGPIDTFGARSIAENYIKDRPDPTILPDKEKALYSTAKQLLLKTTTANGQPKPMSFSEAWRFKQDADSLGTLKGKKEAGTHVKSVFDDFADALNQDIESSIPKWKTQPNEAIAAWKQAKQIVGQRKEAFDAGELSNLLNNEYSLETINNLIDNPRTLKKALIAGNLELPGIGKISSTNVKRDLQGFKLQTILDNAKEINPNNPTGPVRFNAGKLLQQWRDPKIQESLRTLYSAENRADIDHFLTALSNVSQKPTTSGKIATWIRVGGAGLTLGGGLATAGLEIMGKPGGIYSAGVMGVTLGLHTLGKVLTNKKSARYFTDLMEGRALGVSDAFASRMIFGALQGSMAELQMGDGSIVPGKIVKGGRFEPLQTP